MKIKNFVFSLLTAFLLLGFASALTLSSPTALTQGSSTAFTVTNNNTNPADITVSIASIVDGANQVTFSASPSSFNLLNSTSRSVSISELVSGTIKFGSYDTTVSVSASNSTSSPAISESSSLSLTFVKTFCRSGSVGEDLSIKGIDISSDGDEDEEWKFLDNIKIEVEVENLGDEDLDDIIVQLALFDSAGKDFINDLDFSNADEEKIELGDLNDGDEETVTFEFKVPADAEAGDYKLAVKAYSKKEGESNMCTDTSSDLDNDYFQSISINEEDDEGKFIAFDNIDLTPEEASCGDEVDLSLDVFNVGEDDQDQVKVTLVNDELNIDSSVEIKSDLEQGDKARVSFTFTIPNDAEDKTYSLKLSSEYDYKNGLYRENSDESFDVPFEVIGCSGSEDDGIPSTGSDSADISASLASDAVAGQDLVIKSTITNLRNSQSSFIVGAKGYQSWAELKSVSDRIVNLAPGASKEVTFTFAVKDNVEGEQTFSIETLSGNNVDSQQVGVTIEPSNQLGSLFKGNGLIWVIGAINLLLIIVIIIVAVKIARR